MCLNVHCNYTFTETNVIVWNAFIFGQSEPILRNIETHAIILHLVLAVLPFTHFRLFIKEP